MCELFCHDFWTSSVSGQASINPSSLPTDPLNRARGRTAVQGKKGLTTVLTSLSILIPFVNYSAMTLNPCTSQVSGQEGINRSSPTNSPFKQSPCEASCSKKKGGLKQRCLLFQFLFHMWTTLPLISSVTGQAGINPSSPSTVPLNRVRVRTAVQRKKKGWGAQNWKLDRKRGCPPGATSY